MHTLSSLLLPQVHFNKDKSLKREVHLVGNSDVQLSIIEPLTSNKEETLPIKVRRTNDVSRVYL